MNIALKKERGKTPSEVLQDHLKRDDIEYIIVIVENKDGIQEHEISAESDNDALLMLVKAYHTEANYHVGVFE